MKSKIQLRAVLILFSAIIIISFFPSIKLQYNQTVNRDFIERVESNALSANIKIVQLVYETGFNSTSTSVSAGASGVIIQKEGNKYFALTANHVIKEREDVDQTDIVVMGYDDMDIEPENLGVGVTNYYSAFSKGTVEYTSDKYDLALISFVSDEDYNILALAGETPKYGEQIATISNPNGKRNIVTAGEIRSKKNWDYEDESGKFTYSVIKHTAFTSEGSSGSALINEELEIVGINLGGNENIFRQFVSGMAIPIDQVRMFLGEWDGYTFQ